MVNDYNSTLGWGGGSSRSLLDGTLSWKIWCWPKISTKIPHLFTPNKVKLKYFIPYSDIFSQYQNRLNFEWVSTKAQYLAEQTQNCTGLKWESIQVGLSIPIILVTGQISCASACHHRFWKKESACKILSFLRDESACCLNCVLFCLVDGKKDSLLHIVLFFEGLVWILLRFLKMINGTLIFFIPVFSF